MKTLNINTTPNYYLIIMEDEGRGRLSVVGRSVWALHPCMYMYVCERACMECGVCVWCRYELVDGCVNKCQCVGLQNGILVKSSSSRTEANRQCLQLTRKQENQEILVEAY